MAKPRKSRRALTSELYEQDELPPEREYVLPDGTVASNAALVRAAWETGVGLAELKLHAGQYELYQMQAALGAHGRLFELCSRRYGKTWEEIVLFETVARMTRKAVMRFAAPTKNQAREIVIPNWQIITEDCPPELRAVDRTQQEGCYIWPTTGSRLYLAGTDDTDQIDRLRGPFAHLILVDELGFHHCDLKRLIYSVLAPQLATTRGRLIMSTTPPESMDHPAMEFIKTARDRKQLVTRTVFDNPMLNIDDIRAICAEVNPEASSDQVSLILNGEEEGSPAWEREYMCRLVTDKSLRVIREFSRKRHVENRPRPKFFTPYTFLDIAFTKDNCAALFCYLDFSSGTLVVEDEWVGRAKTLSSIRDAIISHELIHWPEQKVWRYGDGSALGQGILATLGADFNCEILPCTMASEKDIMINSLREFMGADRIKIHPRCENLIQQLEDGIWDMRTGGAKPVYKRSKALGHLDAVDALTYGVRSVDWHLNPTPLGKLNEYDNLIHSNPYRSMTDQQRAASRILRGAFRGN